MDGKPLSEDFLQKLLCGGNYQQHSDISILCTAYRNALKDIEHYKKQAEEANRALIDAVADDLSQQDIRDGDW